MSPITDTDETGRESRARRHLAGQGYGLRKSRVKTTTLDDYGGYLIYELNRNCIEAGPRYDLTLDDVEAFAADRDE